MGHVPVLVADMEGRLETAAQEKCLTLGVLADHQFVESRLQLRRGSTLFLYTDGVTDARNGSGTQFGADRLVLDDVAPALPALLARKSEDACAAHATGR